MVARSCRGYFFLLLPWKVWSRGQSRKVANYFYLPICALWKSQQFGRVGRVQHFITQCKIWGLRSAGQSGKDNHCCCQGVLKISKPSPKHRTCWLGDNWMCFFLFCTILTPWMLNSFIFSGELSCSMHAFSWSPLFSWLKHSYFPINKTQSKSSVLILLSRDVTKAFNQGCFAQRW